MNSTIRCLALAAAVTVGAGAAYALADGMVAAFEKIRAGY